MSRDVRGDLVLKLKEIFRSDRSDLDFGIYRILKHRRKEINKYIEEDLVHKAEETFGELAKADLQAEQAELDQLRLEINRDFGEGTIDEKDEVTRNHEAPKIKLYMTKREKLSDGERIKLQINDVFNHVYEFFNRYYDKGDFISQRRFGGREKYVIPYNGEEVSLYWANQDQYYVKTTEDYNKYTFKIGDCIVVFKLVIADLSQNNKVGENLFFQIHREKPLKFMSELKQVDVFFEHRALTEEDLIFYGLTKSQQKATKSSIILEKNYETILEELEKLGTTIESVTKSKKIKENLVTYTSKNEMDYFIHKNLGDFLRRELEFYIKNEVLDVDEWLIHDEENIKNLKNKIRAIRKLAEDIIDFLDELENYQKKLFEKKKFVLSTNYCITLNMIPEELYNEIISNQKQIKEWQEFNYISSEGDNTLYSYDQNGVNKKILNNKNLVIDTKHFSKNFKYKLLGGIENIDDVLNGFIINSENYQALNLIKNKYSKNIKSVYIDPPYNTGNDEFIYRDKYMHSSWMSMIYDRLFLSSDCLSENGTIGVSIDNKELENMLKLLSIFYDKKNIITVKRSSVSGPKVINPGVVNIVDYLLIFAKNENKWDPKNIYKQKERDVRYNNYVINKEKHYEEWEITTVLDAFCKYKNISKSDYRKLRKTNRDQLDKEIDQFVINNSDSVVQFVYLDDSKISKKARDIKKQSQKHPTKIFHLEREKYHDYYMLNGKLLLFYSNSLTRVGGRLVPGELISDIWDDVLPNDLHNEGGVTLRKGKKPEKLVGRYIELSTEPHDIILDYFVGSGTTCAAAQKLGRKWIGIDFGSFFESILIRRLKNTLFGESSGISSITNWKGGGFFKYQYLEQYEDTLNNILFTSKEGYVQTSLPLSPGAFINYILRKETQGSPVLLNIDGFKTPFEYKIKTLQDREEKEVNVDLVETFNYLLGIKVEKIRQYSKEGVSYIIVYGEKENPSEKTLIIWRDFDDTKLETEKQFIEETVIPELHTDNTQPLNIYVNVDSYIKGAQSIEPTFKELMGIRND